MHVKHSAQDPFRPILPDSLWCQHRAIRLIGHGNTDETFQKEKNIGLGNWINIINQGQESVIHGVCFLLGADHRRLPCTGMRMGIIWPVQWPQLSWTWPDIQKCAAMITVVNRGKTKQHSLISVCQCYSAWYKTCPQVQNWASKRQRGRSCNVLAVLYSIYQQEELECVFLYFSHSRHVVFEGQTIWVSFRFKTDVIILPLIKAVWTAVSVALSFSSLSTRSLSVYCLVSLHLNLLHVGRKVVYLNIQQIGATLEINGTRSLLWLPRESCC